MIESKSLISIDEHIESIEDIKCTEAYGYLLDHKIKHCIVPPYPISPYYFIKVLVTEEQFIDLKSIVTESGGEIKMITLLGNEVVKNE